MGKCEKKLSGKTREDHSEPLPHASDFGLNDDDCNQRQIGGRLHAQRLLQSFLYDRGEDYTKAMSSPVSAFESCSRLSPYLAFGCLSIREVFQYTEKRRQQLQTLPANQRGKWGSAIRSFNGRLRWHCHFIQKLEDQPEMEFKNLHSAYDPLRNDFNTDYFSAWCQGQTGYPMVDACMRALTACGWINFRMRAMLMSFACYHLWLHWREPALHLARLFTDYEPGVHYSQSQMQSGTTGINAIRIYNPIKQGLDHDPTGIFIRQWIPELSNMPLETLHTPWKSAKLLNGYPLPLVDEKQARTKAASILYGLRKNSTYKTESNKIVKKHGSRRSSLVQLTQKTSKK